MNDIKVSLDAISLHSALTGEAKEWLDNRIAKYPKRLKPTTADIQEFAKEVGSNGRAFCSSTFTDGVREKESFEQAQLFPIDFNGKISLEDVVSRGKQYNTPVLFAYDTSNGKDPKQFRAVFMSDISMPDIRAVEIQQKVLMSIFPEADKVSADVTRICMGAVDGSLYFNKKVPKINIESSIRNMTRYWKERYGDTNYKRNVANFARANGIALNRNKMIDISIVEDKVENRIENQNIEVQNDKISPSAIILSKDLGEKLSSVQYRIKLEDTSSGVQLPSEKSPKIHGLYRSSTLNKLGSTCRLIKEFYSGEKEITSWELQGIASNIIQVESGAKRLIDTLIENYSVDINQQERWKFNLSYWKQMNAEPLSCAQFCPYNDTCLHGRDMLETAKPKKCMMVPVANYAPEYYTIEEAVKDLEQSLLCALDANDMKRHILNAPTSIGKTTAVLKLIVANPSKRFMLAVPLNILKHEVFRRAIEEFKIFVAETPSLDELKDDMPADVWEHIDSLRKQGRHHMVNPYVNKVIQEQNIKCLKEYQRERQAMEDFDGTVITTHRKAFLYDEKTLQQYDAVIIDEDPLAKTSIPNQGTITISELEALLKHTTDGKLIAKIKKCLKMIKKKALFKLPRIEWDWEGNEDEGEGMPTDIDIPSFCMAEHFCFRMASEEQNLGEDSISFFKQTKFHKNVKYIIMSATVDETICNYFFGEDNVEFYNNKRVRNMGTTNQYHDKSYSRSCIDKDLGIFERIKTFTGNENPITFKKYERGKFHFGNTEGSNELEGQNIDVIGTPYHAEFLYKLFAFSLGLEFDENANMKSDRVCTHNGYTFRFTTFDDEVLRNIHFWLIESDLEQAVGRARLLRNDCTVNVFSNFPLKQAVMREFEYDDHAGDDGTVEGERKELC